MVTYLGILHATDVQPVDPLELWDAPPFEPTVDRQHEMLFHGRGVSDDKGGLLQPIHVRHNPDHLALLRFDQALPCE